MKIFTLFLFLSLSLPLFPLGAATPGYPLQKVEDGDTLVVDIDGQSTRLQLLGIDAPEDVVNPKLTIDLEHTGLSEETLLKLGRQASNHLRELVKPGQMIVLRGNLKQKDKYGRIPVIAFSPDGHSLNAAMIADGYAMVLGRYPLDKTLKQQYQTLEAAARAEKRGLWGTNPGTMQAWSGPGN